MIGLKYEENAKKKSSGHFVVETIKVKTAIIDYNFEEAVSKKKNYHSQNIHKSLKSFTFSPFDPIILETE